jgi:putative membrane protein
MKKIYSFYLVLILMAIVSFGFAANVTKQDNFWMEAAQGGMAEVMLGNLALQKSPNEEVKKLAQMLVTDHTKTNDELKTLAESKNVTLPTDVNAKQKALLARLNRLSEETFDKEFVKAIIRDHEADVKLFQKQADSGTDQDVKTFAVNTLPTLKAHLEMAKNISDNMKGMNTNMNSNVNMLK